MKTRFNIMLLALCIISLSCINSAKSEEKIKKEIKIIETNGIQTYCEILGEGEPLVIIHGGPGMAHNYLLPKFKRLAENYKVIFYDQRANGKTTGEENPKQITVENMVEDLEALRIAFGIEKMNLIGQSWGGTLALNYATKYHQNLKSLIILESGPASSAYQQEFMRNIMNGLSEEEKTVLNEIPTSEDFLNNNPKTHIDYYYLLFQAYFFNKSFHKELYLDYFTEEMIKKNSVTEPIFAKYFEDFDIYNKLNSIVCPTLIIHGENDPIPYKALERVHDSIKGSQFILLKNCGHFAHIEKSEDYFSAIEVFLSKKTKKIEKISKSPSEIVQQQLDDYNAQNLEAFLGNYSTEIEIFIYPNTLVTKGLKDMRIGYEKLFEENPERNVEIVSRTVLGNFVIDKEKITGNKDGKEMYAIAIFEVKNELICKAWFIIE